MKNDRAIIGIEARSKAEHTALPPVQSCLGLVGAGALHAHLTFDCGRLVFCHMGCPHTGMGKFSEVVISEPGVLNTSCLLYTSDAADDC